MVSFNADALLVHLPAVAQLTGAKENAATSGKVNGVDFRNKATNLGSNTTPKSGRNAISKWAKRGHKAVARSLGFALILGTESAWHGFTIVLLAHLTEQERAALVFAALNSLDEDNAYMTASVALFGALDGEGVA